MPNIPAWRSTIGRRLTVACLLLPLIAAGASAQRERAVVRVESFGGTSITAPAGSAAAESFGQSAQQVQLSHRMLRDGGNTMVLVGGLWRRVTLDLPATGGAVPDPATLDVATADLWVARTLDDTRTLFVVLRPGLYGDGADVGSQLRLEGAVFVDKIRSPRTTVGYGLSLSSNYGRVLPIPVVHVVARPRRQLLVDALLPARADLWWLPRRGLDIGVGAALTGAQYALSDQNRLSTADRLWLANATIGPQLRWSPMGGKLQVTADVGTTVLRRAIYADGSKEVADLSPGNVGYARLGLNLLF